MIYRFHESEDDPTFAPYQKAAASPGSVYLYGCPVLKKLKRERDEFVKANEGKLFPDCDPWLYQYDLELFCFLEYDKMELQTGIPRSEHFWRAASIRWPMERSPQGRPIPNGKLYRNPWGEDIIEKACKYQDVTIMGGSGQGKTTTPLALMLMIWEQFIETPSGARGLIASVSEDKLLSAAWSALTGLDRSSRRGISKYVGRGEIMSSRQVRRPNMPGMTEGGQQRNFKKDHRGIIATALVGGTSGTASAQKGIDKLSGSHVPTAMIVVLDEYQSMPDGPEEAVVNLFTHPRHKWIFKMGNPNSRDDNLGKSAEPVDG